MSSKASSQGVVLRIAVLSGGRSSEHEVSLSSGRAVREGLAAAGHEVIDVEIGRDGVWRLGGEALALAPAGGLLGADVVFPVLHGPFGEDGTVQGVLETLDVAYVGADVAASAVCLDKVLFKQLMSAVEVAQVDHLGVREREFDGRPGGGARADRRAGSPRIRQAGAPRILGRHRQGERGIGARRGARAGVRS